MPQNANEEVRNIMRRYVSIFIIVAIAIGMPFALKPCLGADEEESPSAPVTFHSILPKIVERAEDEDQDKIDYDGIDDEALQKELEILHKKKGYNYFESLKSRSAEAEKDKTIEYRFDDSRNHYCKYTVTKIEKWTDDEDKEHTFITGTATVVIRKKVKDENGDEKIVDEPIFSVTRRLEAGKFIVLVFPKFYPKSDDEPARDFILAINVGE